MPVAPYRVHRMIQDLMADPAMAAGFAKDPAPVFDRYQIAPEEIEMLECGTMESMHGLGVHPNLQMKYLRLRSVGGASSGLAAAGPLDSYLARLTEI